MKVLFEDNHLLVVDKPAGMATMGAEDGQMTAHRWACDYVKRKYNKPGNVYIGVVSRLDRLTTGTLVLARTSKAASRLTIQFGGPGKSKKVTTRATKIYLAVVEGNISSSASELEPNVLRDQVYKDDAAHRMRVDRHGKHESQLAELRYSVLAKSDQYSLVAVKLLTGRKHQIRLQFADRGFPVVGDKKYGSQQDFGPGIALHSWQLAIEHPTKGERLQFSAPIPGSWSEHFPWVPSMSKIEPLVADWI
ncbi:RluA family pseudouridine synthase [Stieleria sp. JC731]|uniref:RluA family pseudouridine synthase n=1 Tax=Pirellulaceae TaxID=2691357 RepID=UPI001E404698|nr:RluA family pseudouridine synthase [Stieleria sp. JC731]MCC9600123.1 RluA family pseudouridine synthase [Stieleria sp. JC731]